MRRKTIPKQKRLIGHTKEYDVYETPSGGIFHYTGKAEGNYRNIKFWKMIEAPFAGSSKLFTEKDLHNYGRRIYKRKGKKYTQLNYDPYFHPKT